MVFITYGTDRLAVFEADTRRSAVLRRVKSCHLTAASRLASQIRANASALW